MTDEITNLADLIDSRDIRERIEELEDVIPTYEATGGLNADPERHELAALRDLWDQLHHEREHGLSLVRDSYFTEHVEEEGTELFLSDGQADNPLYSYIDWERWARDLQSDYYDVDFGGVTYWVRS